MTITINLKRHPDNRQEAVAGMELETCSMFHTSYGTMRPVRSMITRVGSRMFRWASTLSLAAWLVLITLFIAVGVAIAASSIADSFTDTSKIASSVNLIVYTGSGSVTLAGSDSWTCGSALIDARDAKTYATVLIGTQCWMAAHMNIGTMTAGINNQGTDCPSASAIEKYCYSDNTDNCTSQGGLYQWDQAMCGSTTAGAKGICPTGWHLPTDTEQHTLDNYLSTTTCDAARSGAWDCSPAGTSLKSGGASGFTALLAGDRETDGSFAYQSSYALFWTSTESAANAWYRALTAGQTGVLRNAPPQAYGLSVRCLKD